MEFKITKADEAKLSSLVKMTQTVSDVSVKSNHFVLKADGNKLFSVIYGNGNAVKFATEISDLVKNPTDTGYFYLDMGQFLQSIEKVFISSGEDVATVNVETTKVVCSAGKSKISFNLFDTFDTADCEEAFNAIDSKKATSFTNKAADAATAIVTQEIMDFADVVGKFITMIGADRVTGLALEGNTLMYSDQAFSIVKKTLSTDATSTRNGKVDRRFIPQSMFAFLSSLVKIKNPVNVTYSDDDSLVYVNEPDMNFEALLSMPLVVCEYPDDATLASICPDPKDEFRFDIDIPTFLTKMSTFDGVFPSSTWRWKSVDFSMVSADSVASLAHSNFNAEVDTDLPVTNPAITSSKPNLSFKIATIILYDYLNKLASGNQTVNVEVGAGEPDEEHGAGIKFTLPGLSIVMSKMLKEEEV